MTIIKRMHMRGFKSFAKPIDLEFGPAFNCIIGPNGSGKSNIMDALCFVFGKLSAKSMRAEKASNLIFNGGKKGGAMKEAEVSIFFDNRERVFPLDAEDVKLTRVIKQVGGSVYKINNEVRTRQQVLEVLGAAKIDPDGHNIILQGDIVQFMEMKPEDRGKLIEEISGILIYDDKKEKALNELSKVEARLNEAVIILKEREVYLRELKKDRDQALKYKELEKNIKSNKATYLHNQMKEKEEKRDEVDKRLGKVKENVKRIEEKIEEMKGKIAAKKEELSGVNKSIEEKGEKESIALQKSIDKIKTELVKNTERLNTCKNELGKIEERKKQLRLTVQDIDGTIKGLEESKVVLTKDVAQLSEDEKRLSQRIQEFKAKYGMVSNAELEDVERKLDEKMVAYQELQKQNEEILQKKYKADAQVESLREKIGFIEKNSKDGDVKKVRSEVERVSKELSKVLNEDSVLAQQLQKAKEEYARKNDLLFKLQTTESSRKDSVMGDLAVKRVLESKKPGIYGTVNQLGKVEKKYALALEVAAGPRIKSIVVEDDKIAAECIRMLKETKAGIATFLPLNKISERERTTLKGEKIYGSALDLISFDPKLKKVFSYVFANTLVVEDIEAARRIGIGKVRMVTLGGDLVELSGAMVGGYRHQGRGVSFQEKDVEGDLKNVIKEVEKLQKTKEVLDQRRGEVEQRISVLRGERGALEGELIKLERATGGESASELRKRCEELSKDGVYKQYVELGKELVALSDEIQKLKKMKESVKGKSQGSKEVSEIEKLEEKRQKVREQVVEKNTQVKNIITQIQNIYVPEKEKTLQIVKQHEKELTDFKGEAESLEGLMKKQREELKQCESEELRFQKAYKELFQKRNKVSEEIQRFEGSVVGEFAKINVLNDRVNEVSVQRAKVVAELEALQVEFEEFRGVPLRRGLELAELKEEIKKFEQMLAQIGNVNLRALEVYESIQAEYDELLKKVDKLNVEKNDVLELMAEIESKKKDIFMKTFDVVNKNFMRIFSTLSSKGDAFMELENKEQPLSGGIDIRVRIAGNKYLDIRSLSGGEKTMTALAFIFAIQEHQPAPFYLLDEVDAALDKKNSELLSILVAKYATNAQYIMISHNDHVITEADYVYGVSMHQTGISKIVSLKI